ncbi:hypothetical protein NDU88_006144 [Pleurodeles waltl]|uniref:Uncharacterized protein n=1 Tax=Pleurodeles waltl TaxID=8319 RepID=A0AAV7TCJ0_PLEWA|nr:hypothetical protein NDU88_006144 [Pleurodeles waltl]
MVAQELISGRRVIGWRDNDTSEQLELRSLEPETYAAQTPDARRVRRGGESLVACGTRYLPTGAQLLSPVDPAGKRSDRSTAPTPTGALEFACMSGEPDCGCSGWCTPPAGGPLVSGLSHGFPRGPLLKRPIWVRLAGCEWGPTPSDYRSKRPFPSGSSIPSRHAYPALNIAKRNGALPAQCLGLICSSGAWGSARLGNLTTASGALFPQLIPLIVGEGLCPQAAHSTGSLAHPSAV